jgi:DNA-directed RNA polymerase specialized sigma24 family protein
MSTSSTSILDLLRLCIVQGQTGPWEGMLAAIEELVASTYRAEAPAHQTDLMEEFRTWLPGWLAAGQKLERAHEWLEERVSSGDCRVRDEQEGALRNYLRRTIRSGVGDFFRERSGRSAGARSLRPLTAEVAREVHDREDRIPAEDRHRLVEVRERLAALPFTLQVPFRLRYFESCGPLSAQELAWAAEQSGLPQDRIEDLIKEEAERNRGAEFPLGADFIGQLLAIPPGADGRYTTVDQRVCRARQRLRERLASEDERR